MKPLYTQKEFNNAKPMDKLPCECYNCSNTFYIKKSFISHHIKRPNNLRYSNKFCSQKCAHKNKITKENVICSNCYTEFLKKQNDIKKSKSGNHFCSRSCSATYNNKHKIHGNRRSKLEKWIEIELTQLYPNLKIDFNKTSIIGSELDIYIPKLNIAFELNGIFHYEPIYGSNKLTQIKENDISKSKACHDAKIDLCVIDTSTQTYFKPSTSQKYLDIINNIVKERL